MLVAHVVEQACLRHALPQKYSRPHIARVAGLYQPIYRLLADEARLEVLEMIPTIPHLDAMAHLRGQLSQLEFCDEGKHHGVRRDALTTLTTLQRVLEL